MFLKWIAGIVRALNSNQNPAEIGAGAAYALLLALVPAGNALWFILFALMFFLKLHQGTALLLLAFLKLIVPLADGLLHPLGYFLLSIEGLQGFYTWLYNLPLVPLTRFNNTVVMGGLVTGLILWVPVYIGFTALVKSYRNKILQALKNSRFVKWFSNLPMVKGIAELLSTVDRTYSRLNQE